MNISDNHSISPFVAFIGLDWGDRKHAVALREAHASSTQTFDILHSPETIHLWLKELENKFEGRPVAIALETGKGPLIHMLVDIPWLTIYPIHPATSARIRKAFTPSGAKDDTPDSLVLLGLLLNHIHQLRPLKIDNTETRHLAGLCELRRKSIDHRTQLCNQLRAALKEYYPQALELIGNSLYSPLALQFLKRWPNLFALKTARPSTIKKFYFQHNVRRQQVVQKRINLIDKALALTSDQAVVDVRSREVARLGEELMLLQKHILEDDQLIHQAFNAHSEADLFRNLPGAGPALAPRLLTAFGTDRQRFPSANSMQCYSGVAPVKEKSAGRIWIHWRWNAPRFLRQTLIEWAGQTIRFSQWARAYYDQHKQRGKRHWAILRSLAFIWVRILWRCWHEHTPYNEKRYLESLRQKGSKLLDFT